MLQAANTDLFNPLVSKAHNSECQNILLPVQIKPSKVNSKLDWRIFIFSPSALMGEPSLDFLSLSISVAAPLAGLTQC